MQVRSLLVLAAFTVASAGAAPPQLLVQNGHSGSLTALVVTPDGRHLITGGADSALKIWDAQSGRVESTRFLPVGRVRNGAGVASLALSSNGRVLAVGTWSSLTLWDVSSPIDPHRIADLPVGKPDAMGYVPIIARFAKHDQLLVAGLGQTVKLYRVKGTQATFEKDDDKLGDAAYGLSVSADGTLLATGDNSDLTVTNLESGQTVKGQNNHAVHRLNGDIEPQRNAFGPDHTLAAAGGGIGLWDAAAVQVRTQIPLDDAHLVTYSPDGSYLAATATDGGSIHLWNVKTGQMEKTFGYSRQDLDTTALQFTPDSKRLIVGYTDGSARAFDTQGRPAGEFQGHSHPFRAVAFTPDGQAVVTNSLVDCNVWSLRTGRIRAHIRHDPSESGAMAVTADGRRLALGNVHGGVDVVDARSGALIKTLNAVGQRFQVRVTALAWSPDGTRLACGTNSGYITVLDVASGTSVVGYQPTNDGLLTSLAFADARTLVSGWNNLQNPELQEHDIPTRTTFMHRPLAGWGGSVEQVAATPDGTTVVALLGRGTVASWPLMDDKAQPKEVKLGEGIPVSMAVAPDGRHVVVAMNDGPVQRVDLVAGKVDTLLSHAYSGWGEVALSPDGAWLVTASEDAVLRFWPAAGAARPVAEAVEVDGGQDWIVTDPQGRFDGTSGGQRLMEWRLGDKIFALEQFFNTYYTPGLLHAVVSSNSRNVQLPPVKDITSLPPPPRLLITSPESGDKLDAVDVTVKATITDEGGGVSKPSLSLNGHRLPARSLVSMQGATATFQVRLGAGANHLHLSAFNRDGSIESRGDDIDLTCTAAAGKPTLYVVAVGIDHYKSGLSLSCARSDAQAMAAFFKPGLFSAVKPVLLTDDKASKRGLLAALAEVARQTSPGDTVVVYLAGHGTVVGDVFYFLPWDVQKDTLEEVKATGLSSVELGEALVQIPATKQILILDACHSGAAAGSLGKMLASRGVEEDKAVQRLAHASGSFLIAAAKDDQTAKEVPTLHHGLLTYAILHGLGADGPPAASTSDGTVTVNALLRYLSDAVPQLTEKYQAGASQDVVQASTGQDFPIVLAPR